MPVSYWHTYIFIYIHLTNLFTLHYLSSLQLQTAHCYFPISIAYIKPIAFPKVTITSISTILHSFLHSFFTIHVSCPRSLVAPYTTYLHAFYLCHFFLLKSSVFPAAPNMFSPLPPVPYYSHKSCAFLLLFNTHYYFLKIHYKLPLYAFYNTLHYSSTCYFIPKVPIKLLQSPPSTRLSWLLFFHPTITYYLSFFFFYFPEITCPLCSSRHTFLLLLAYFIT